MLDLAASFTKVVRIMFTSASLKHRVDKATFKREEPKLREALLSAQYDLAQQKRFPVLILIGGVELAGKGETTNLLSEWFDPRTVRTTAFDEPTQDERERPSLWRYWHALPPKGRVGMMLGAWHTQPIVQRVFHELSKGDLEHAVTQAKQFERMLAAEGTLIMKFWLHVSKKFQRRRLDELASHKDTAWRVGKLERDYARHYDRFRKVSEHFVRSTSTGEAPWYVVSGEDEHYRALTVGKTLLAAMRERLDEKPTTSLPDRTPPLLPSVDKLNVIRALKLNQPMEKSEYEEELNRWQGRLATLSRHKNFQKHSLIIAFEGNDAAGKGGAIRRVTQALDARIQSTVPVAAPTEEERAQPYLWRFWRQIPRQGRVTVFDRSWYGRVLVERVEGVCPRGRVESRVR